MRFKISILAALSLFALNVKAFEPLKADLNPALYTPFVAYYDVGSNQHFYYDNNANTFYITGAQPIAPATITDATVQVVAAGDPTGLLQTVNYFRSLRGLHPFAFDGFLYNKAINNNAWQRTRGMGHYDYHGAQNSAWGAQDVNSVINMWTVSPGHAATLYGGYTFAAIAFDGLYWTLNAR